MEASIKIAVIGFGRMGQVYAHTIRQIPGVELYAVADPTEQARSSARDNYGVTTISAEPETVIGLPELSFVWVKLPARSRALATLPRLVSPHVRR